MKTKLWLAKGDVQAKNSDTGQLLSVTEVGEQWTQGPHHVSESVLRASNVVKWATGCLKPLCFPLYTIKATS